MSSSDKPLVWLAKVVKTPPLSDVARLEAGYLLRMLQKGNTLSMPHSKPMPAIGDRCHELRITDETKIWRIFYRIDKDAITILDWDEKKSQKTSKRQIQICRERLKHYDAITEE